MWRNSVATLFEITSQEIYNFCVVTVISVITLLLWSSLDVILATNRQCPEEISKVDDIKGAIRPPKWPATFGQTEVHSDPLCLSNDSRVITRECRAGKWWPQQAPLCTGASPSHSRFYCPPGYTAVEGDDEFVCVTVSRNEWSETCLFSSEVLDLRKETVEAVYKHLRERRVHNSWLPIRRLGNFGPLLWNTPGRRWGSPLKIDENVDITYGNRSQRCLLLDVTRGPRLRAEACNAAYPYLCVTQGDYFHRGACPEDHYSSPIPSDRRCFHVVTSDEKINWQSSCNKAQIDNPLISNMLVGLSKSNGLSRDEYCWIGGNGRYKSNTLAMSVSGNLSNLPSNMTLRCVYCQTEMPEHQEPRISLKFYHARKLLLLNVFGESGLWRTSSSDPGVRCFTTANVDVIESVDFVLLWDNRWTAEDVEPDIEFEDRVDIDVDMRKKVYSIDITGKGPGYYICQGHTVSGQLVSTKQVIAYEKLESKTVALGLDVASMCRGIQNCYPTYREIHKKVNEDLRSVGSQEVIEEVHIMEIIDISAKGIVTVLFHVTAKDSSDDDEVDEAEARAMENAIRRTKELFQLLCATYRNVYSINFLRSCDRCPRSVTRYKNGQLTWPSTYVGMTAVPEEICLDEAGLPVHRVCNGNYMHGGTWLEASGNCATSVVPATRRLYEISKLVQDPRVQYDRTMGDEVLSIVRSKEELGVADIYYLSEITRYEAKRLTSNSTELEDIYRVAMLLDKVMSTDQSVLGRSKILNATNTLLDSLEILLNTVSLNVSDETLQRHDGVISIVTSQLIIQISDPNMTNVTGLALVKNLTNVTVSTNTFSDYTIVPLTADFAINDVVRLGVVEVATWLPRSLIDTMLYPDYTNFSVSTEVNSTTNELPKIIVTLFYSDIVFASEFVAPVGDVVDSRVVSVSVPGYGVHLPVPIPLLFKPLKGSSDETATCAFWDFNYVDVSTVASFSGWSNDGCQHAGKTRDLVGELNVCLCSHLTHFAQLVLGYFPGPEINGDSVSIQHGEALEVITVIGCILSLIGVFGILITATVFKSWRKKPGTKVLIQLTLALGLEKFLISVLSIIDGNVNPIICILVGAMLHYSVLAQFSWMLVTAWLQFKRYVTVLGVTRPPRFLLKASAFAWGTPLLIVTVVTSIDPNVYMPEYGTKVLHCQVSGIAQYVGLLAPVIFVTILNMILFIRVIYSVVGVQKGGGAALDNDAGLVIAQVRLAIMLFFLLGITWVFGLAAKMGGGLFFSYLFCITAALQGFVLFLFFIVCDPSTRKLWYSVIGTTSRLSSKSMSASSGISEISQQRY